MTVNSFSIDRVPPPRLLDRFNSHELDDDLFGEQAEWGFAIPWTFRALANPKAPTPMPRAPEPDDDFWPLALGYWSALFHLLVYGFGWSRPDRGLRWWYDNGKPTDDPKLALLSQLWLADGQLDWFAAWLWTTGARSYLPSRRPSDDAVHEIDQRWLDAIDDEIIASRTPSPFSRHGGCDPLHLGGHIRGPVELNPPEPLQASIDADRHRSTLTLETMKGWYRALLDHGEHALGSQPARTWTVELHVSLTGPLGNYRRSRATGLWYTGLHRHHLVGN